MNPVHSFTLFRVTVVCVYWNIANSFAHVLIVRYLIYKCCGTKFCTPFCSRDLTEILSRASNTEYNKAVPSSLWQLLPSLQFMWHRLWKWKQKVPPKSCYQYTRIDVFTSTQCTRAWISAAVEMAKLYTKLTFPDSVVEVRVTIGRMEAFFYHHVKKILRPSAQRKQRALHKNNIIQWNINPLLSNSRRDSK
jgi:hypothetical protein